MAQKATGKGKYKFAQNFTWNSVQQIESLIIPNVPNPPGDPTNPYLAANTE
jgi:hypothetical protein